MLGDTHSLARSTWTGMFMKLCCRVAHVHLGISLHDYVLYVTRSAGCCYLWLARSSVIDARGSAVTL